MTLMENRIKKNRLLGDKETTIELFKKHNILDTTQPKTVMSFMFKECHACKVDLPHIKAC